MKLFLPAVIALSSLTSYTYAQSNSQVVFTPKAGESTVKGMIGVSPKNDYTKLNSSTNVETEGNSADLDVMYGVDEQLSLGASIDYKYSHSRFKSLLGSSDLKTNGMSDLLLKMRMTSGMFVFGGDLGLPFENQKLDLDALKMNRASGGLSLTPMAGIIMTKEAFKFGGVAEIHYLMDRKGELTFNGVTTTDTVSGGSFLALSPFAEWNYGRGVLYGKYTLRTAYMDEKNKSSGDTQKPAGYNSLTVGSSLNLAERVTGLAEVVVDNFNEDKLNNIPSNTTTTISLGARVSF